MLTGDGKPSTNIDRLIGIVHHSDAANSGNWCADCRQSGTPENHDSRVKRLDYNDRMVLHCARQTNSHKTRRFWSKSSGLGNIRQQARCDTRDSNSFTARGIRRRCARSTQTAQHFRATFSHRAAVAHLFRLAEKMKDS